MESIYPAIFRKINGLPYERERISTPDDDFLDIDWLKGGNEKLIVLSHGLEGDSRRQYMAGMARLFFANGWDVLAWNNRSCSGEMNRARRMYHHGDVEDLGQVVEYGASKVYKTLVLAGFSMGGNQTLKYLGVKGSGVPAQVAGGIAFSAPTDLEAGAAILDRPDNVIYKKRFLHYLSKKITIKEVQYPGTFDLGLLPRVKSWRDFDEWFSAPLNGFEDAAHFYKEASARNFMFGARVPVLLVQAENDPILPKECYPVEACKTHPYISLEITNYGGHVGFLQQGSPHAWSEVRALDFAGKCAGVEVVGH
ncbi:MAG: alpha/beta fold hydrolase [Saprospiraceae bacterium]